MVPAASLTAADTWRILRRKSAPPGRRPATRRPRLKRPRAHGRAPGRSTPRRTPYPTPLQSALRWHTPTGGPHRSEPRQHAKRLRALLRSADHAAQAVLHSVQSMFCKRLIIKVIHNKYYIYYIHTTYSQVRKGVASCASRRHDLITARRRATPARSAVNHP